MNFINRNLTNDLPLAEIARQATFPSYHFHRILKAVVGETVSEFIADSAWKEPPAASVKIQTKASPLSPYAVTETSLRHFTYPSENLRQNSEIATKDTKNSNEKNAPLLNICYTPSVRDKPTNTKRIKAMNVKIEDRPVSLTISGKYLAEPQRQRT